MKYVLLFLIALAGCGGELPEVDCNAGAVPKFSEVAAFNTCNVCHSSQLSGAARNDAPSDVNYDTYAAAMADAEAAVEEVAEGKMPPEGYSISEEQKQALYRWGLCGTPQ